MSRLKNKLGYVIIIIFTIIPLIIWSLMLPLDIRFADTAAVFKSIGQVTSLAGTVLLSITLILITRLKFLEDYFGGQDKVLKAHRRIGLISFILVLFHPLFLAMQYVPTSLRAAALFLIPATNLALNLGTASLTLMIICLFVTIFTKIKYQRRKFIHQLLGIAFLIGALHAFLIPSDISRSLLLRYYMLTLIFLGFAAYTYRTLLGKKLVKRFDYRVNDVKKIDGTLTEITLSPEKEKMTFTAGQFIFIGFINGGISKEFHPFTISSSPKEENIQISVKALGDYTSQISNLKKGSIAKIEGPFGRFSYELYKDKPQIWIAGGIGITPFLSMARSFKNDVYVDLYYSVRKKEDAIFLEELHKIASKNKKLRVIPHYSSESGHLDIDFIKKESKELMSKEIFICGPAAMMHSITDKFINDGISKKKIHSEEFSMS